jgi:HAMP domain-containing protein
MLRIGLRHQLIAWFLLAGVTPAVIGIASLYWFSQSERILDSGVALQARADAAAERFSHAIEIARRELVLVAEQAQRAREAKARPDWDAAAAVLSMWGDRAPVPVEILAVHDPGGTLLLGYQRRSASGASIDLESERALSAKAVALGRVVFGGDRQSGHGESSALGVAVPVIGAEGTPLGALYGAIPVEWFVQALTAGSLDGGSLWIADETGRTIVSTNGRAEVSSGSAVVSRRVDVPGVSTPWTLSVAVPNSAISAQAGLPRYVALIVAAFVLALVFAWGISGIIVRPIREIDEGTRRITQGDLDFQISTKTRNELERLVGSFQQMAYDLKRAQERLTKAERLAAIGEVRLDLHRELQDHLARVGNAGQRLQGRSDLPIGAREQVSEMVDAIAGVQTAIQHLEHAPDRTVEPAPRSRGADAAMPSSEHHAEGVA